MTDQKPPNAFVIVKKSKASTLVLMLFMGSLLTGKAQVQEVKHAPTIEQCRADQRLWLDKLERALDVPLPEDYRTLVGWTGEMRLQER